MENKKTKMPEFFYKYMPFNDHEKRVGWIKEILFTGDIFIPSADLLNDPFEQSISIEGDVGSSLSEIEKLKIILKWKERKESTGVLSVSTNWKNLLMWAHYAASHQGICIEFLNSGDSFKPVTYVSSFPSEEEDFFLVKSMDWKYENEYRFVTESVGQKTNLVSIGLSINSIILGANFKEHELFAKEIYPVLNKISLTKVRTSIETFKLSQFPVDEEWFDKILTLKKIQRKNS